MHISVPQLCLDRRGHTARKQSIQGSTSPSPSPHHACVSRSSCPARVQIAPSMGKQTEAQQLGTVTFKPLWQPTSSVHQTSCQPSGAVYTDTRSQQCQQIFFHSLPSPRLICTRFPWPPPRKPKLSTVLFTGVADPKKAPMFCLCIKGVQDLMVLILLDLSCMSPRLGAAACSFAQPRTPATGFSSSSAIVVVRPLKHLARDATLSAPIRGHQGHAPSRRSHVHRQPH